MKILVFMFEGPISNIKKIQFFFGGGGSIILIVMLKEHFWPHSMVSPLTIFLFFFIFLNQYIYISSVGSLSRMI